MTPEQIQAIATIPMPHTAADVAGWFWALHILCLRVEL